MKLEYEVIEAKESVGGDTWRVEAIDDEKDGQVYVTIFAGPEAEERAREYAEFKNA